MGAEFLVEHDAGCFLLDEALQVVENSGSNEQAKKDFAQKHPSAKILGYPSQKELMRKALLAIESRIPRQELCTLNLESAKHDVSLAITEDILIIQAIKSMDDIDKTLNSLTSRLRDWYELYLPEYSRMEKDPAAFAKGAASLSKAQFEKENNIKSFGANLPPLHENAIRQYARRVGDLGDSRQMLLKYLDDAMQSYCPNLKAVAGTLLGARLIDLAGGLRRLTSLPSSTIQILGAEKALFRHLKTGSRPPKYGILLAHDLVQKAPRGLQGRAARILANKIGLAVRIDFFKGEFRGDSLLEEAGKKIGEKLVSKKPKVQQNYDFQRGRGRH